MIHLAFKIILILFIESLQLLLHYSYFVILQNIALLYSRLELNLSMHFF